MLRECLVNISWENSKLVNLEKLRQFLLNPSSDVLEGDLAYQYAKNLVPQEYIKNNFGTVLADFQVEKNRLDNLYLKALLEKIKVF